MNQPNPSPPYRAVPQSDRLHESDGEIVDLFAGPGGWDVAARQLGLDPLGIEKDEAACLTRARAGLRTLRADVSKAPLRTDLIIKGEIASPPCQTFSMAGKGAGRDALDQVLRGVESVAMGAPIAYAEYEDPRTGLVLEPLAWALRHNPEWLAWEQVPTVLPVWEACAAVLRAAGYSVATGALHAEQYGVPQTRKRAVLVASRTRIVSLPEATHTKYRKGHSRYDDSLQGLLPWASMADALGWGMTDRPYPVIACARESGGPDKEKVGGSHARAVIYAELAAGRWEMGDVYNSNGCIRNGNEPAPTVTASADNGNFRWRYGDDPARPTIRLALEEAGVLQSFPADYPWVGNAKKRFQQVGNAVPPLMAQAVLMAASGLGVLASEVAA